MARTAQHLSKRCSEIRKNREGIVGERGEMFWKLKPHVLLAVYNSRGWPGPVYDALVSAGGAKATYVVDRGCRYPTKGSHG